MYMLNKIFTALSQYLNKKLTKLCIVINYTLTFKQNYIYLHRKLFTMFKKITVVKYVIVKTFHIINTKIFYLKLYF